MSADRHAAAELPIVQYWHSDELPAEVTAPMATFRDRNPGMPHLAFDREGAEALIAKHHSEREVAAFRACAVPAMQADYFRYCAILALGGVYADVGYRCLRPLGPLLEAGEGGTLFALGDRGVVINGFFYFGSPGHPLLRLALEVATTNIEQRVAEQVQMVTGPWIFSALNLLRRLGEEGAPARAGEDDDLSGLSGAFAERAVAMAPTPAGRATVPQMVDPLLRTVGGRDRLARAFEGVRVLPFDGSGAATVEPVQPLPYKQDEEYWINWQKRGESIFAAD